MDKPNIRAAGYVRVSGKGQIENESLSTQGQSIKDFAKQQGWKLVNIYADEGISGGTVKERHALLQCLHDGRDGKFNVLAIHRLSRFGRNARELLDNNNELEKIGIQLRSIKEGIDFSTKYGRAILGFLAIIAELEREIIRETMLENRIARGRKGIPTSGSLPFGRTFNKETGKWELDEKLARLARHAAKEYLQGASLRDISAQNDKLPAYANLIHLLRDNSGTAWTVNFKDEEPITCTIPRILDDATIQQIREQLAHNRIDNRRDAPKYPLTGFIRCEACGKSLYGQTQNRHSREYKYYNHTGGKHEKCKAFASIPLKQIENAVFRTIFENTVDAPAFERAIADSLPDEKLIKRLEDTVKQREKELRRIDRELDKLVDLALSGALKKETIKSKETSLLEAKVKVTEELEEGRAKLRSMPDLARVKQEAEAIRRELLEHFSSEKRMQQMSFGDKKRLLHWLFDGKDRDGKPYGIYISKKGRGPGQKIDYFLWGRITGLRTLKGDDIHYQKWDEDEDEKEYKTNNTAEDRRPQISRSRVLAPAAGQSGDPVRPSLMPSASSLRDSNSNSGGQFASGVFRRTRRHDRDTLGAQDQREQSQNHRNHGQGVLNGGAQKVNCFNAAGILANHKVKWTPLNRIIIRSRKVCRPRQRDGDRTSRLL